MVVPYILDTTFIFLKVEWPSFELACPRVICASQSERGRSFLCILILLLLLLTSSPAMNAEGIIHRHPASIFPATHPSIHPGYVGPRESETSKRREGKKPPCRQRVYYHTTYAARVKIHPSLSPRWRRRDPQGRGPARDARDARLKGGRREGRRKFAQQKRKLFCFAVNDVFLLSFPLPLSLLKRGGS